jgi:hypothetical protein
MIQKATVTVIRNLQMFWEPFISIIQELLGSSNDELVRECLLFFSELILRLPSGNVVADSRMINSFCHVVENNSFANGCRAIALLIETTTYVNGIEVFELIARFIDTSTIGQYAFCALAQKFLMEPEPEQALALLKLLAEKMDEIAELEAEDTTISTIAQSIRHHLTCL